MSDLERAPSFLPGQESAPVQPEQSVEQESAVPQQSAPQEAPVQVRAIAASPAPVPAQQFVVNDPRAGVLKQVESLLSDGLKELYMSLPEARRAAFKQTGEMVANKITDMIMYGKAKVKEVWKLIGEWLRVVPGVNKYFLEQEIKIKTDRVMMFAEQSAKA
jgi:hypothetical protein